MFRMFLSGFVEVFWDFEGVGEVMEGSGGILIDLGIWGIVGC